MAWSHDKILGGPSKQRVTYDQLSITQFIQGFTRNVLDEPNHEVREKMLWCLNELMEDASDFSWASAKACHAVLLCEMERGSLDWHNTNHIDRIQWAHAQNIVTIAGKIREKMLKVKRNLGSVNYFSPANVNTPRIMNLVEKFKKISVLFALVKVELVLILKRNVIFTKNLQQTSKELLS